MTDEDYSTFDRAFRRVCGAFRIKLKPVEQEELTRTYFRVLAPYPIDEVVLAGKACLTKFRTFPRVADWLAQLSAGGFQSQCPPDRRVMTVSELDEQFRAERLRYQDHSCLCSECCRAAVDDKPVRFVPSLVGDSEERAFNQRRSRVDVVGHWAHGDELAQWYAAKDAFFALAARTGHRRVLQLLSQAREPGQEG